MTKESLENSRNHLHDEISVRDLIMKMKDWYQYLLSKLIIIIIWAIIGGLLGFAYSYFKKPVYVATTTFVLEEGGSNSNGLGNLGGLASIVGLDMNAGGGIFQGDNILELYKSRTMIEKTLLTEVEYEGKKILLVDRYIDVNDLKKKWENAPELSKLRFKPFNQLRPVIGVNRLQDSVLGIIVNDINKNYLNVGKPDKKLNIIRAEVKASDEFFAKAFNNQVVKNVNDFYIQTKTKKSLENIGILQQKTDSIVAVMNGAIYTAAAVSDATPNINPTRQVQRIVPIQRSQFTAETNKAILGELVKNLELSKISQRRETPLIQVVDEPVYPLQKEKLGKIKGGAFGFLLLGALTMFFLLLRKILSDASV